MNLKTLEKQNCAGTRNAVALVITLLMLSVITFLAIAFLAMTTRDKNAVTATLDMDTAKSMSEAALARAQAEIIAQMMSTGDLLNYDYRASHNFINPGGYNPANPGLFNNVNYDYMTGGTPGAFSAANNPQDWAQNINDLFYDPRPPVFVTVTPGSSDFRYWVDLNRNGMFESNGLVQMLDNNGNFQTPNVFNLNNGEPEWIGVLKYPQYNHSATNIFLGRFAYMVLPIGKTLDWNFIHNYSKTPGSGGAGGLGAATPTDQYSRDEGVGSWELNLAGLLANSNINTNIYTPAIAYKYSFLPAFGNTGLCFNDAVQLVRFRYASYPAGPQKYPLNLTSALTLPLGTLNNIDEYGEFPPVGSQFDYNQYSSSSIQQPSFSWPGSYNTNMFYDVQDFFDPSKTGPTMSSVWKTWMSAPHIDSYDRYSFQRLLACIGTSSAPEYGVFVYPNGMTNAGPGAAPTAFRTKVNINYDNSDQIQAGPYSPMSTNLVEWVPLKFFTNAADLLLSSQEFPVTNLTGGLLYYNHFGLGGSGIPIYNSTNASFCYNAKIHRMLQLAANIYEATSGKFGSNYVPNPFGQTVYIPHVYRPLFAVSNSAGTLMINISGYTNVGLNDPALSYPYYDLSNSNALAGFAGQVAPKINIWGIPWVVGTVTGLPSFNKYSYANRYIVERKLLFVRNTKNGLPDTSKPPLYTNQILSMGISNIFGMDAWNPYLGTFPFPLTIYASNSVSILVTNNYNWGTNIVTNFTILNQPIPAWAGSSPANMTNGFKIFFQTNILTLPPGYFSEITGTYNSFTNPVYNGGAIPADLKQTTFPVHTWFCSVTNHVLYYIYAPNGRLLDYVNLGPFGTATNFINSSNSPALRNPTFWDSTGANNSGGLSMGMKTQIGAGGVTLQNSLNGLLPALTTSQFYFEDPAVADIDLEQDETIVANDPLVHYTLDDLNWPGAGNGDVPKLLDPLINYNITNALTNLAGQLKRYDPWPGSNMYTKNDMLFRDPLITSPNAWQFPTNDLPNVGWLGRIHRGTPWQTIYLKSDNPSSSQFNITEWGGTPAIWTLRELPGYATNNNIPGGNASPPWVNTLDTYPTRDWALLDLFTAVPNDNAARGLLSVNQTNSAAWAAVFAGVIVKTDPLTGVAINPTNDISSLVDATNVSIGINAARATGTNVNGLFHHIGDILQVPALTTQSPFLTNYIAGGGTPTDDMVERIPQQTLGLLKLGLPQFVIYSWGQSLRPKNLYQGAGTNLINICTNYEITGEFLTRTVCHVVGDPTASAPKIVVDSYNIEPGN